MSLLIGWESVALLAVVVLVALDVQAVRAVRSMSSGLAELAEVGSRMASGDASRPVDEAVRSSGDPALADLADALERMRGKWDELWDEHDRIQEHGKPEVHRLAATTQEVAAAGEEIAATVEEVSTDATRKADSIERASEASHMVASAAREVVGGVADAVELNTSVRDLGEEQAAAMTEVTRAVNSLAEDVGTAASEVRTLAESSERIGGFVETIQQITRQTELLALNAAIEAARAGEDGRGFAVVADEVRKLADHASSAAVDIKDVVGNTLSVIGEAETMLAGCAESSEIVTAGVTEASKGFDEVVDQMRTADSHLSSVHTGIEEIDRQVQVNVEALDELSAGTTQLAAAAQQMSASSQELAGGLNETAVAAEKLSRLIDPSTAPGESIESSKTEGEHVQESQRSREADDYLSHERVHA